MEHVAKVTKALNFIETNLRDRITVDDIAAAVHFSTSHFHAIFARVTGLTVAGYARMRRLACAALDLAFSRRRIIDIALEYRFESQEAFTRAFKRAFGVTPGAFRRGPEYSDALARLGVHQAPGEIQRWVAAQSPGRSSDDNGSQSGSERRLVLPNIPRVGFFSGGDICPEDIEFPSCLAAVLRHIGAEYPWIPVHQHHTDWRLNGAYAEMLAASGMAFGLLWRDGWHHDNGELMFIADPREIVHRAFAHAGYSYEFIEKRGQPDDESTMRESIKASLRAGRPVLALGVIGPPSCCLITGYDDDGDVLIGWNYFQGIPELSGEIEFEPCGYFRKRDWFRNTIAAIVIGDRVERADAHERNRDTLRWGIRVAATPEIYGRHSGFAAYTAWADQLLDDGDFATDDVDVLRQRQSVHDTAVGNVAECRWYAYMFLREMAKAEPAMAADLLAAADRYDHQHTLMWQVWGLVGGNRYPQAHLKLAEPETRRQITALIRAARDCDGQAAAHLQRALSR